ncbi:MAG: protein-methionine-sulfoxide reductase catalytic subunit MsrP [Loktanella sp.]|jgi:sulfoxide reductase catalytic subunit YedY|nr:protein-methionine-sulfoxide reductase catalytic subunit MsrP [Loktanella sp.]MDO7625591.1 protein-methionine-sulfoxide reductase catalytic subunit MsrP [Loktanella sp.]MDO7630043.1 protein-methionine-sulfoxide reductase catalytic subunit MsrP [Loktanella sp.]MDO7666243.1 protein-methionine-sulfoxide reductase catalytic subunit MsrP [Loktanella sp.]MDO7723252.1 protein-methionine-sulfoxide reductase catalytic subunit MsrP [Loktanella sp.]
MAYRWTNDLTAADVTPKSVFFNRRQFFKGAAGLGAIGFAASQAAAQEALVPNSLEDITTYNNFYEFGTGKDDPAKNAGEMITSPWRVKVDGLVDNPGEYSVEELLAGLGVEERIYRFRCVEAWAMVVPWNGVELSDILNKAGVQANGKYVAFETVVQPETMVGVRQGVLDFPYVEGLRMDEAMHPLTMLATGIYGEPLANQSGAPIRLVVPWKYGFKSIKSIVRITVTEEQPEATWNRINPREYGFYSNVNPEVDHPRWSQGSERLIGGGLFAKRQDTLKFNGYDEVANLYDGMDLRKEF